MEKINDLVNAFPQIDFFCSAHEEFKTDSNGNYQTTGNGTFYHKEISPGDILVFDAITYASNKKRWCCGRIGSSVFRTKAVRGDATKIGGGVLFSENLDSGEDGKFHFEMALRGRICLLNEILMHYRIDVPAEKKARRQRTKSMQSAWVSHLNEYDELLKSRPEIKCYLDRLRLGTTLSYRGSPIFKKEIKEILKQVSPENWTLSFRLLHCVPYPFQKAIFALWNRVKRII